MWIASKLAWKYIQWNKIFIAEKHLEMSEVKGIEQVFGTITYYEY